jgi:DNA-binding transcriptional ArsR family regulator
MARKETHWVEDPRQLACLASPVRMDIVDHLAGRGPTSIKDLAREIGREPSSIYHHVRLLADVGLVIEAGARVENRKSEKLDATPAPRMRLKKALGDKRHKPVMRDIVAALCRESERDFAAGLNHPRARSQGDDRNLGFFRLVNRVDRRTLKRINALLDEVAELLWQDPAEHGDVVALTWTMTPLGTE